MKKYFKIIISIIIISMLSLNVFAHSGRTDSLGGHNVKTAGKGYEVGTYHYHTGKYAGWIVNKKGDVPNPNKDKYDPSLVTDGSISIIKPIIKTTKPVQTPKPTITIKPSPIMSSIFNDLRKDYWATLYIENMKKNGIIDGYPDGSFKPENNITREQFAKLICKVFGLAELNIEESTFSDVQKDRWSYGYIEAAKIYLTGYFMPNGESLFKPDSDAIREDIVVAIVKCLNLSISDIDTDKILKDFKDVNNISPELKPYIAVAIKNGLIKGFDDKTLQMDKTITRAESSTILYRIFKSLYEE